MAGHKQGNWVLSHAPAHGSSCVGGPGASGQLAVADGLAPGHLPQHLPDSLLELGACGYVNRGLEVSSPALEEVLELLGGQLQNLAIQRSQFRSHGVGAFRRRRFFVQETQRHHRAPHKAQAKGAQGRGGLESEGEQVALSI